MNVPVAATTGTPFCCLPTSFNKQERRSAGIAYRNWGFFIKMKRRLSRIADQDVWDPGLGRHTGLLSRGIEQEKLCGLEGSSLSDSAC